MIPTHIIEICEAIWGRHWDEPGGSYHGRTANERITLATRVFEIARAAVKESA